MAYAFFSLKKNWMHCMKSDMNKKGGDESMTTADPPTYTCGPPRVCGHRSRNTDAITGYGLHQPKLSQNSTRNKGSTSYGTRPLPRLISVVANMNCRLVSLLVATSACLVLGFLLKSIDNFWSHTYTYSYSFSSHQVMKLLN